MSRSVRMPTGAHSGAKPAALEGPAPDESVTSRAPTRCECISASAAPTSAIAPMRRIGEDALESTRDLSAAVPRERSISGERRNDGRPAIGRG
eukprot:scaffold12954_cov105-Isochrysis_galbana.AAC.1